MASYNYDLHAVSNVGDFSTLRKNPRLVRSLTSAGSATFKKQVGLVRLIPSAATATISNVKRLIFLVLVTSSTFINKLNVLSQLLKVYSVVLPSVVCIPGKLLSVAYSITARLTKGVARTFSIASGSTIFIVKNAVTQLVIQSQGIPLVRRGIIMPSLFTVQVITTLPSLIKSSTKSLSRTVTGTATFQKWCLKVLSIASSITTSVRSKAVLILLARSIVYALGLRTKNLSAVLVSTVTANPKIIKIIGLIKSISSPIILAIGKIISKPMSITVSVTATLPKKLYQVFLVSSLVIKYLLRGQTLFKTLSPVVTYVATISRVSAIRRTYSVILFVASNVSFSLPASFALSSRIAQTFSQTLEIHSQTIPSLSKRLSKTFSVTISSVLDLIRSWG